MVGSMVMVVHALDNAQEDNKVGVDNFQKKLMSSICFVLFTFFTKFRQALFSHATVQDCPGHSFWVGDYC